MNIIHADIKPGNFLLVAGQLKLIDFGLAMEEIPGQSYVEKQQMLGTKEFMSPEVLSAYKFENGEIDREAMANRDSIKYTKMVDIWALGIILYNIVYETQPFSNVPGRLINSYSRRVIDIFAGGKNARIQAFANPDLPVEFSPIDNIDPALLVRMVFELSPGSYFFCRTL